MNESSMSAVLSNPKNFSKDAQREVPLVPLDKENLEKSQLLHKVPSPDDDIPSNVGDESQLYLVPEDCLSGDDVRPLLHIDDLGNKYRYALQPMVYSVILILIVELLERFCFYGIYYTQTLFLTGERRLECWVRFCQGVLFCVHVHHGGVYNPLCGSLYGGFSLGRLQIHLVWLAALLFARASLAGSYDHPIFLGRYL